MIAVTKIFISVFFTKEDSYLSCNTLLTGLLSSKPAANTAMGGLLSKFRHGEGTAGGTSASREGTLDNRKKQKEGVVAENEVQDESGGKAEERKSASREGTPDRKKKMGTSSREGTLDRKKKQGTSSRDGTLDRKNKDGGGSRSGTLSRLFGKGGGDGGKSATLKSQNGAEAGDKGEKKDNAIVKLFRRASKDRKKDRKPPVAPKPTDEAKAAGFEVVNVEDGQQAEAEAKLEANVDTPALLGDVQTKLEEQKAAEVDLTPPAAEVSIGATDASLAAMEPTPEAKNEVGRRKPFLVPKSCLRPYRSKENIADDQVTNSPFDLPSQPGN